jgi:hypothetical protein
MESKKAVQENDQKGQELKKTLAPQFAFSSRVFSSRTAMRVDRTNFNTKWSSITNSPLDTVNKSKGSRNLLLIEVAYLIAVTTVEIEMVQILIL